SELAELFAEEGQIDEAIRRWEQVVTLAEQDIHQKISAQLEIAQLLHRKEKNSNAIKLLTRALEQVEPDSWLAKEIHRRIETIFRERNDHVGEVAFYTERCRLRPDDLTSALLLAAALNRSGKPDDAIARYRSTIAVAPSRRDVREALIATLE